MVNVLHVPGADGGSGGGETRGVRQSGSLHMSKQSVPTPKQKKRIDRHSFTAHSVKATCQTLPETHLIAGNIDKSMFMVFFSQ